MARDPLSVLHAVRQRAVEQARQALGACLHNEIAAADRIRRLDDAVSADRDAAGAVADDYRFLEMFALRQATLRTDRCTAAADLATAEACSGVERAAVVVARAAAEAVEQLMGERAAAERAEADRREQHALDDIARPRQKPARADRRVEPGSAVHAELPF